MQGGAEVRAVEWKHPGFRRQEPERLRLPRIYDNVDVVFRQTKAVYHVGGLLDIGQVDHDLVANARIDPVGEEATADRDHLHFDAIALAHDTGVR
ncbi:hypothetical protein D3C83_92560 [compost metagenome]